MITDALIVFALTVVFGTLFALAFPRTTAGLLLVLLVVVDAAGWVLLGALALVVVPTVRGYQAVSRRVSAWRAAR